MLSRPNVFVLSAVVAAIFAASRGSRAADATQPLNFSRDVRPILANNCFQCHGPDAKDRKADLRLDVWESAGDLHGAQAVIDGKKPADSELIARITSDDADERMPPADSGKSLRPEQIEILKRWVNEGGKYGQHWAFVAPRRPELPKVKNRAWVRNPIDAFVLARLEREGLEPTQPANGNTLLRRLSLDLVGLPPSLDELAAFEHEGGEQGYQRAVDRLLASSHYGERWGRVWLDVARYADSDGFEKDKPRFVWMYRDGVINALNQDLPYDQFIIQQIAGDRLPHPAQDERVATGFLRNSMINEEGGIDPEQFRMEAMYDRMDAIGKGILGLTIQCAQCHSHKYDPLTQAEYYRMFAFLNSCHEAQITVYTPPQQEEWRATEKLIKQIENRLRARSPDWQGRMAAWEDGVHRQKQSEWTVVPGHNGDESGQKYYLQKDGSILAAGYAPTNHSPEFTAEVHAKKIAAIRLELLNDPNLPHGGPGRSLYGTCALTEFEVTAASLDHPDQRTKLKFSKATADANPPQRELDPIFDDRSGRRRVTGPIEFANDGNSLTAWGIDIGPGRSNVPRNAVFVLDKPLDAAAGVRLTFKVAQHHGGWNSDDNQNNNLGRFRFSVTADEKAAADPIPADVRAMLQIPLRKRTAEETAKLFSYWRTTVPEWNEENRRIEALWQSHPQGATQLALEEREEPRTTHRLERGNFLAPAEAVTPGVPAFLHPLVVKTSSVVRGSPVGSVVRGSPDPAPARTAGLPPASSGRPSVSEVARSGDHATTSSDHATAKPTRLDFARWLADRKSPTTARSIVNRIWQAYFGTGIVATAEDLGSQGEPPSHPQLLDWLAVELMDHNWSLKHIHRLIVNSATYRQSSHVTPQLLERDPANRLLARGPRYRVDAESVRDVALAASGLLTPTVGGPSVFPPAPEFLFLPPASYGPKTWIVDTGPDRYRRAIYTFRFRSVPYPVLQAFDAPIGEVACARRARSNTPLQALTTLNEPLFVECARALALKLLTEGGATDEQRIAYAVRRCLSRAPKGDEEKVLSGFLDRQRERFHLAGADPWPLLVNNDAAKQKLSTKMPAGTNAGDLAAWTAVARVILNLDETITKE
jgi:mono/diheme cytochrome c family protein